MGKLKKGPDKIRCSIQIEAELNKRLVKQCEKENRSRANWCEIAIKEKLERC